MIAAEARPSPAAGLAVHLARRPEERHLKWLAERLGPRVRISNGPDLPEPADYEVLVAGGATDRELEASPRLRAVVIPYAGVAEEVRERVARRPGVTLHNLHHNAAATAEMALALLLAAAKRLVPVDRAMRALDWSPAYDARGVVALDGRTALVLGFGAVGRRVARACLALGMRVITVRRRGGATAVEEGVAVHPVADLDRLLPEAHAIVVTLPLTAETTGLLGPRQLAALPPGALLVNVGRGAVIDEQALYEGLRSGRIGAAGLDVWYQYPKDEASKCGTAPSRFPIHELDNVVLSPHRAGSSEDIEERRMAALADLLDAAARGDELPNRVDVEAGY